MDTKQERRIREVVQCKYSALCGERVGRRVVVCPASVRPLLHPSGAACALIATDVHYCFQLSALFEFSVSMVVSPVAYSHYLRVELHSC